MSQAPRSAIPGKQLEEGISSVVYTPQSNNFQDLPPVLLVVQNEINQDYVARVVVFCLSSLEEYKIPPIVLFIALKWFLKQGIPVNI